MCVHVYLGLGGGGEGRWGKHKENQKLQNKAGIIHDLPIVFATGGMEGGATTSVLVDSKSSEANVKCLGENLNHKDAIKQNNENFQENKVQFSYAVTSAFTYRCQPL